MSTVLTLLPFSSTHPGADYSFVTMTLEAGGEIFDQVEALQAQAGVPVPDHFHGYVGDEFGRCVTGAWGQRLLTLEAGQLVEILGVADDPDAWVWNAAIAYLRACPPTLRVAIYFH